MSESRLRIVSAQVPSADARRLVELAREHDRTLSAEIRRAVAAHLAVQSVYGTVPRGEGRSSPSSSPPGARR